MIRWPALLIGAAVGGALAAMAALVIAALAGGAVSPIAGAALGLAFGLMAGRLVSTRHAVLLGAVAAISAAATIAVVTRVL